MSEPLIWEITMPGKPTQQFIPLAFHKQKLNDLQAEVERLRKAGDALSKFAMHNDTSSELWIAWTAAKEGKQS